MKTQLLLLSLFFISQNLLAQEPLIAVSDQMNVIYIGIPNPVTVAVEGVSSKNVSVWSEDLEIEKLGDGKFNLLPTTPGKVMLKVQPQGHAIQEIPYRVKRIPDAIAKIGNKTGGTFDIDNLKYQSKLIAHLQGFDLGKCEIQKFEITAVYKRENADPTSVVNKGGEFSTATKELIETLQSGDTVYFDRVTCNCPGDPASRKINSLIFQIR